MLPLFEGASDRERKRSFPMLLFSRLLPVGTINFTSLWASGPVLCPASNSSINRSLSLHPSMPTSPLALPPSIDTHQALGSPSGRAGAKRLRGLTAPILHTKLHSCTNCLHIPLPLPTGGTSPGGRGKSWVQTSNSAKNRNLTLHPSMPTVSLALPPSIDTHQALGSPSGRAGAKRLRGITAPILPTSYPQSYCTDSLYEIAFLHELSAHPSPPPFGRYLSGRERQGAVWKLKTEQ